MPSLVTRNRIILSKKQGDVLDEYPNAVAAYSLRSLKQGSDPVVVRVRRSSDNSEADFKSSELKDGTLATWVGANDGFVVTWYDQSGNGVNFTNSTANLQPTILQSGTVNKTNNKPSINGFDIDKNLTSSLTLGSGISLFSVTSELANIGTFLSQPTNQNYLLLSQNSTSSFSTNVGSPTYFKNSNQLTLTNRLSVRNNFYLLGQVLLSVISLDFSSWTSFELERSSSTINGWGIMQELIFYSNSPSRTGVESNINQYYSIY
jgi:hypothetical protein